MSDTKHITAEVAVFINPDLGDGVYFEVAGIGTMCLTVNEAATIAKALLVASKELRARQVMTPVYGDKPKGES